MKKAEAKKLIEAWDALPAGPEKNRMWDKIVPAINEYRDLWLVGKRAPKPAAPEKQTKS